MEKDITPAQPAPLIDVASYQRGSIVSRTLIDKKTGTVTLFAFDEGQRLSEHTAPMMPSFSPSRGKQKSPYRGIPSE